MPKIIVKKGDVQVDQYIVESGTVRIGRTPDNQIVLNDPSVSRSHAEIKIDPDSRRITIVDLNSSNGTYVNGIRISRIISSKATVGVGVYQLEIGGAEQAAPMAPAASSEDVEATMMFAPGAGGPGSGLSPAMPTEEAAPAGGAAPSGSPAQPAAGSGSADSAGKKKSWLGKLLGRK
jgi:predicted component of type VI protein secretion system